MAAASSGAERPLAAAHPAQGGGGEDRSLLATSPRLRADIGDDLSPHLEQELAEKLYQYRIYSQIAYLLEPATERALRTLPPAVARAQQQPPTEARGEEAGEEAGLATSAAGGGSASTDHPPLLRGEEGGQATSATGKPVGGPLPSGQPSPPKKRTSTTTTGGAGKQDEEGLEADNKEEGGPASRGGQGLPPDKFVKLGNGAVNVGFSAADVGAFFYLICDMEDAEAAHTVATLEENIGLERPSCGRTIAAWAANRRADSQCPGLEEYETDDPIFLWCQALVGVCGSLKKHNHISWLTHVDRAWGRQFAQRAIRGFHDWEYNFPFGAEVAEVPEEQFEALSRVKGGMAALICDINSDNELIFTLSPNKEDPLQVFRTLDKIADIVDWWIPRGIGGNTVVICPTYLMLPIRTMAAWCSQRRRAEIIKGTTPSRQLLYLPTSCALLGNLSHLLHGNGKWSMGKATDQTNLQGEHHQHSAEEQEHWFYNKKVEYEYKDKRTAKHEDDTRGGHTGRAVANQNYKPYEQGWADNLQQKSEDWAKAVSRQEHKEEKYYHKNGKEPCWFFNKGQCTKGKNCNFAHEHYQGRPAEAKEAPKAWEKHWKNEYEEKDQSYQNQDKKGKYYVGAGDYGGYNSTNKDKYQRHVSGTSSYSRHDYSSSPAPRKYFPFQSQR